ncbi:hypothetical protein GCM10010191_44090 [Actinomadura vinacea]|uniref:Sulfotransferase family protein n=1 Tax=Actinomadura vinacea TaxID=115336 RepID=A0ABN3JC20_9ACTN
MTSAVYVHVGAPKSGTTFLQNVMWHNREALAAQGLLYPGGDDVSAHVWAAFDLRGAFFDGHRDPVTRNAWARLVDEVRAWDGPAAVISQELLASARPRHVERALADLDFAEVHLVYTARDLARQIPAHWQEDVKNRSAMTFGEFVAGLRDPESARSPWVREFWRMQDAAGVLERWAGDVPPERVHVVTLPPPGASDGLLLERFCAVLGVDAAALDTSQVFGNPSLGVAETELIRRINLATRDSVEWPVHDVYVKHDLAQSVLTRRAGAVRIRLPEAYRPWVLERSRELVEALSAAGYRVAGDLDDLLPGPSGGSAASDPDQVLDGDVLDAALDAVAQLLRQCAVQHRHGPDAAAGSADLMREQVARLREDAAHLAAVSASPVKRVVRSLSERNRLVMSARAAYWRYAETARRPADETERGE